MNDYLFKKNLTVKRFAFELGISTSYLYQLLRGERNPSLHLAHRIEKHTNGEITAEKLLAGVLNKKNFSDKEITSYPEIEAYQGRLCELETRHQNDETRFDSIEKRLFILENGETE